MDLPRLHQNGATAHVLCTFSKSRVDLYKLSGVGFCSIAMDFEGQKPLAHALTNTWCAEFSQNLCLIALLVAVMTSTGVKVAAISFASAGTLTLWLTERQSGPGV